MEAATALDEVIESQRRFWQQRARTGPGYVGRVHEDHNAQTEKILALMQGAMPAGTFYENGMDFGCGWGRFTPALAEFCGHIWAVDLLGEVAHQAGKTSFNVTPRALTKNFELDCQPINLLWSCLVLQHIVNDALFDRVCNALQKSLAPGARVLILDNAMDKANHVKPRGPSVIAKALGLKRHTAELVTINSRPNDHWLIDGTV